MTEIAIRPSLAGAAALDDGDARASASGLVARNAKCPMPATFAAVSLSV